MTQSISIKLSQITANPYRDLKHYPLRSKVIERLVASINETGFWRNLQVRAHPSEPNKYQLCFGHHRTEAARKVLGSEHRVEAELVEIGDLDMLLRMAHENAEEYGSSSPTHVTQCVVSAAKALSKIIARVPSLELESKAETERGKRKARARGTRMGFGTHASSAHSDLVILRTLYRNEGTYAQARTAGYPGHGAIERFLSGAFSESAVKAALALTRLAKDWELPEHAVRQIASGSKNISVMNAVTHSLNATDSAAKKLKTPEERTEVLKRTVAALNEKSSEDGKGRRGAALQTNRQIQQVAKETGNTEALDAAVRRELGEFMKEIPREAKYLAKRLGRFRDKLADARVTSIAQFSMYDNYFVNIGALINNYTKIWELCPESKMPAVARRAQIEICERLIAALQNTEQRPRLIVSN